VPTRFGPVSDSLPGVRSFSGIAVYHSSISLNNGQ
jgi:hypothetical protein